MDLLIAHATKLRAQSNKHKEKLASSQGERQAAARGDSEDEPRSKRKYKKNDISSLTQDDFDTWADEHLFEYQKHLRRNIGQLVRNILKSRQIGATWYFAFEAFENAVMTGDPQIFLSASKAQAEVFRSYIVNIAEQYFGITLTGNPIRLSNGAELRFLSTNKNTAQSYSGHLYCDEYFWVPNFAKLNEVASAMATHDKWRTTYFSTPSAKTHQAYPFWTGEEWKQGSKKRAAIKFPLFDEMRDGGRLYQAKQIEKLFDQYNFTYLGVDVTGIGQGVFDNIQHFAMKVVVPIRYDMNTKNQLVLKAADVVESQRIEWDKNLKEIPASFMSVRRTTTNSGNAMTFVADRSQDTGHAEAFWAITHALHNEPLNYENKPKSRWGVRKQAA